MKFSNSLFSVKLEITLLTENSSVTNFVGQLKFLSLAKDFVTFRRIFIRRSFISSVKNFVTFNRRISTEKVSLKVNTQKPNIYIGSINSILHIW